MRYTGVLAFNGGLDQVLLVLKQRGPEHLRGTWNGVGGKMEPHESPVGAALREFMEETDACYTLTKDDLVAVERQRFINGFDAGNEVYWYGTRILSPCNPPMLNDVGEELGWWPVKAVLGYMASHLSPNLNYLIPKAKRFLELDYLDRPHPG